MKKRKLVLELYEPHEMALLREGRCCLHYGNFWDFHAGCHGTKMIFKDGIIVDFKEEWSDFIRRPMDVAEMVAKKIGAEVVVKQRKTPFE